MILNKTELTFFVNNPFKPPADENLHRILEEGEIEIQGQFMLGSNYTFLVRVNMGEWKIPAVYKPMRGEQPLWDFPEASLAGREVAAYLLSEALGWGFVPLTVLHDGPFGPGSLQQFIDYDPQHHYFTFAPVDRQRLRPVALFDLVVNNADRKGSHVLLQKRTRKLFAIDHGLCFHTDDKLRTVIWDFAAEPIPEELLSNVRTLLDQASSLPAELKPYLRSEEIDALFVRMEALLAAPSFPQPPEGRRAFPYPPV